MRIIRDTCAMKSWKPLRVFEEAYKAAHQPMQDGYQAFKYYLEMDYVEDFVIDFCLDVLTHKEVADGFGAPR